MVYRVIGLMSGSSLDGLDIVFAEFEQKGDKWNYEIKAAACYPYDEEWMAKLKTATHLDAYNYLLLHSAYGKFTGEKINLFIEQHNLHHQVQLITSHGHTIFHAPHLGMTAQLGCGAAIAAATGINVVSDLRALDVSFGGQGAPLVPTGEKFLWSEYDYFMNIGGIANISRKKADGYIAFDICPANRVLNMLSRQLGKEFDESGTTARSGVINGFLLSQLNTLDYYKQPYPKSLANSFGTDIIFPLIQSYKLSPEDALRTYSEHIAIKVGEAIGYLRIDNEIQSVHPKLLITGGGAFNTFLIERIKDAVEPFNIQIEIPGEQLIQYKEALIMALLGVLRWREEYTVMNSVTGAARSSIGGAVWIGQEA